MAGRIPQPFIDEVVARSDIVEVIGARVPLKKAGREYKACCPFHNEKSPSFWVSPDKQFYHCFGCGAHGTVIGFLMQYEKMEFFDAVADLAQRAGLEMPREALKSRRYRRRRPARRHGADRALFRAEPGGSMPRARKYVERARNRRRKPARDFALGYAPDSWDALLNRFGAHEEDRRQILQLGMIIERDTRGGERAAGFYDRFRDRLMFPIRDSRGRVIGFGGRIIDQGEPKYLNSPETPLFHKGRELYGLYEARQARADFKRLMIVEGYMDVVRLHQAGITYAVATLGTATTQEHLNKIFRLTSEVVFCFDGDRAGRQAAWRALENSLAAGARRARAEVHVPARGPRPRHPGRGRRRRGLREPAERRPAAVRVPDPAADGRGEPRAHRRPGQAQGPGGAPVRPHARGHLPGNARRQPGRAGRHAGGDAQEVVRGRRPEANARGPAGTLRPSTAVESVSGGAIC